MYRIRDSTFIFDVREIIKILNRDVHVRYVGQFTSNKKRPIFCYFYEIVQQYTLKRVDSPSDNNLHAEFYVFIVTKEILITLNLQKR